MKIQITNAHNCFVWDKNMIGEVLDVELTPLGYKPKKNFPSNYRIETNNAKRTNILKYYFLKIKNKWK